MATEIRNFSNPPHHDTKEVIMTVVNFIEGSTRKGQQHTWNTARQKLYEMVNRGVGSREKVSQAQLATLVNFLKTGITTEGIKAKSMAVSYFVTYLHAIHELQEHLIAVEEQRQFDEIAQIDNEYAVE